MSRTVAVIQARLGSARLPDKVLMDVQGRPMLAHVIERAQAIRGVDRVIVAMPANEALQWGAMSWPDGVRRHWVEGDPADVLSRVWSAAYEADVILRLTGDCPLLAPDVAETALAAVTAQGVDYLGTTRPTLAVPDGMDVEVFTRAALETAHREATDPEDREHVTRYIWQRPTRFRLGRLAAVCETTCWRGDCPCGPCWALGLKLSVDTAEDLERVRGILARIPPWDFSMAATLRVCKELGLMPDLPLPAPLWRRLQDFLAGGKTGQLILHVHQGRVTRLELREVVGPREDSVVDSR